MLYFEKNDTRLCLCMEEMLQSFPCAAVEQSPHPTNGTPNFIHLLVIRLPLPMLAARPLGNPTAFTGE